MELRKLKYFIATAEALHFRKAANVVNVTQPALSKQIHELEEEIGVLLFTRNNRRVELTPAGKVFYERARVILESSEKAVHEARNVGQGLAGTLHIGFLTTAAMHFLPEALLRFRTAFPSAEIDLHEMGPEDQLEELKRGSLDIGFLIAEIQEEGFAVTELSRIPLVAALPALDQFVQATDVALKDLAPWTTILPMRHSRHGYYENVMDAYQKVRARPERIQTVRLIQTGIALVGGGLGVALVPGCFSHTQAPGVVFRPLRDVVQEISLRAVWREGNRSPMLQEFSQILVSETTEFLPRR